MLTRVRDGLVPAAQRRTPAELSAELDLRSGGASSRSAYWTMLVLSAVIAAARVLSDSTATVIRAMIIAPLSTPIMGMALGLVGPTTIGAGRFVLGGVARVIAVGLMASLAVPRSYDLLANTQVSGRTSPGPADLLATIATGLAGTVALARRGVAAVPPGVAIAISLVPPLVVVGVCLGATLALSGLGLIVVVPLTLSTAGNYLVAAWENRAHQVATEWLAAEPGATVTSVRTQFRIFHISVRAPGGLPPLPDLLTRLHGVIPDGSPVVVETTQGRTINAGNVGDPDPRQPASP